jgi:hypothetical protein
VLVDDGRLGLEKQPKTWKVLLAAAPIIVPGSGGSRIKPEPEGAEPPASRLGLPISNPSAPATGDI